GGEKLVADAAPGDRVGGFSDPPNGFDQVDGGAVPATCFLGGAGHRSPPWSAPRAARAATGGKFVLASRCSPAAARGGAATNAPMRRPNNQSSKSVWRNTIRRGLNWTLVGASPRA